MESGLMKSEQQCRGMQFQLDSLQTDLKAQNDFIYTHQTTKEFYIQYTYTLVR